MRKPIIAGNWKLYKTISEARELVTKLKEGLADVSDREVIIAPVFTALAPLAAGTVPTRAGTGTAGRRGGWEQHSTGRTELPSGGKRRLYR